MQPRDETVNPALCSKLAAELQPVLAPVAVGASFDIAPSSRLCAALELIIPQVLSRSYDEWANESIDGVFVARATKSGPLLAEILGTCILISDQTVAPVHVQIGLSHSRTGVDLLRVFLGEPGSGALGISGPPCHSRAASDLLANVADRAGQIEWSYLGEFRTGS